MWISISSTCLIMFPEISPHWTSRKRPWSRFVSEESQSSNCRLLVLFLLDYHALISCSVSFSLPKEATGDALQYQSHKKMGSLTLTILPNNIIDICPCLLWYRGLAWKELQGSDLFRRYNTATLKMQHKSKGNVNCMYIVIYTYFKRTIGTRKSTRKHLQLIRRC